MRLRRRTQARDVSHIVIGDAAQPAAAAAMKAAEDLFTLRGFAPGWATPAVAGVWARSGCSRAATTRTCSVSSSTLTLRWAIESA